MKKIHGFILVMLMVGLVQSKALGFGSSDKGTTTGEFLRLGAGARAVSMGEAYSAVADEATALYWNVGALTQIPSNSMTVMHGLYFDSGYFDYLAFAHNFGERGALGVGFQYYTPGDIDKTDINGDPEGTFKP